MIAVVFYDLLKCRVENDAFSVYHTPAKAFTISCLVIHMMKAPRSKRWTKLEKNEPMMVSFPGKYIHGQCFN